MNRFLLIAGSVLLAACAPLNPQPGQAVASASDIVCTREVPTGSRVAVRVCRSRAEIEERQTQDRDTLREMRTESAMTSIQ